MATFQKGDRVSVIENCSAIYPPGSLGDVVERRGSELTLRFDGDSFPTSRRWHDDQLAHHVDSFPIIGSEDPWRETEPNSDWGIASQCYAGLPGSDHYVCSREPGHAGHHLSRTADGVVHGRWPQVHNDEVAAVEKAQQKSGPAEGMPVVRTDIDPDLKSSIETGTRGHVEFVFKDGSFRAFNAWWKRESFGTKIVPAAEWDAQHHHVAQRAQLLDGFQNADVMRDCGQQVRLADGPCFFAAKFGPTTITVTDDSARIVLPDSFTAKLAIAMFESDHAGTVARVTGNGEEGGISVNEARQRLVWRSGEDQRAQYMREAAALLKRAGEL